MPLQTHEKVTIGVVVVVLIGLVVGSLIYLWMVTRPPDVNTFYLKLWKEPNYKGTSYTIKDEVLTDFDISTIGTIGSLKLYNNKDAQKLIVAEINLKNPDISYAFMAGGFYSWNKSPNLGLTNVDRLSIRVYNTTMENLNL